MQTFIIILLVFAVAALTIWVYVLSKRVKTPGDTASAEKLVKLYQSLEELMDSFESYVEEVHEDIENQRGELTELSRRARVMYDAASASPAFNPVPAAKQPAAPPPQAVPAAAPPAPAPNGTKRPVKTAKSAPRKVSRLSDKDRGTLDTMTTKAKKVRFLMSRGLPIEDVARELNIGKGEILLINDLDKT